MANPDYRSMNCRCIECNELFKHIYRILKNGPPKRCYLCLARYKNSLARAKKKAYRECT